MNSDDPLSDWLRSRRAAPVPDDFSRRVMAAIEAAPSLPTSRPVSFRPSRRERLERAGSLLLIACSCIVAVVRLFSLAGLVVPATEDRVITREFFEESEEVRHVSSDVT